MIGKTVLITGAAKRVGRSIARELHEAGANIVVHYRTAAEAANQLASELNGTRPDSALCLQANLLELPLRRDEAALALGRGRVSEVDAGDARGVHLAGDGLVGGQHALLDQVVGLGGAAPLEADGMARAVELALHLRQGEIERAGLETARPDLARELAEGAQGTADLLGHAVEAAGVEEVLHLFVGQAGLGADDGAEGSDVMRLAVRAVTEGSIVPNMER